MSPERSSRLGVSTILAWTAMQMVVVSVFGGKYLLGTLGDPDVGSLSEALMTPMVLMSLPLAAIAFGVLLPCMRLIQLATRGRLPRTVNMLIGAALSIPALLSFILGVRLLWPVPTTFVDDVARLLREPNAMGLVSAFVLGGMIIGWGAERRRRARRTAMEA